jgi:hypothetical protein
VLLADDTGQYENLDRVGFFNMENAIYLTIQPHPKLTLVYSRDGFEAGSITQDAFGMIGGGPWNSYLKAGRFRTPFGLRTDDHTVATRAAFLDYQSGELFLPYDPRFPDEGFEISGDRGGLFARAAFTNGASSPFALTATPRPKTLKLGYHTATYQGVCRSTTTSAGATTSSREPLAGVITSSPGSGRSISSARSRPARTSSLPEGAGRPRTT